MEPTFCRRGGGCQVAGGRVLLTQVLGSPSAALRPCGPLAWIPAVAAVQHWEAAVV